LEFEQFKVGQLYKHDVNKYDEGTKFDFMQSGAIFEIYFSRPTGDEIQDVTRGHFEIGFLCFRPLISPPAICNVGVISRYILLPYY